MAELPCITPNTPALDAKIKRAIANDPDTWEASKTTQPRRRGRPTGSDKKQVTVKLDSDIIAALKTPNPKGWQTRLNASLRSALGL